MRIAFIGDIHGNLELLEKALVKCSGLPTIQVGDLDADRMPYQALHSLTIAFGRLHWIDGNHDDLSHLRVANQPGTACSPYSPYMHNIRRGDVLTFRRSRILALGGGESVAPYPSLGWHPLEAISGENLDYAKRQIINVHAMVTHVPPAWIIEKYLNVAPSTSSKFVQNVWEYHNKPPLICGHIHRSIEDSGVRVLDIGEVYIHEFPDTPRVVPVSPAEQALTTGLYHTFEYRFTVDNGTTDLQALELPLELL